MRYTPVSSAELAELPDLDDWRFVLGAIHAEFRASGFTAAASLLAEFAATADRRDHHPEMHIRYPGVVTVTLSTHVTGGLSTLDVELAQDISALARRAGAVAGRLTMACVEIAIDTTDADRIRPFWAAALGYRDDNGTLVDPRRVGPPVWFQHTTDRRDERQRFHIDVSVPHDQAAGRVEAVVAAGGRLVTDAFARSWWVLADADGNECCICTWQDR